LKRSKLIALLFVEFLGHFHIAELCDLVPARVDDRAGLDQGLLDLLSKFGVVEICAQLPMEVLERLDLLLD